MRQVFSDVDFPLPKEGHRHHVKLDRILSCFYSLAGGVILGTVMLDLIPHVLVLQKKFQIFLEKPINFPITYFLLCIGFFLTYFFVEGVEMIRDWQDQIDEKPWKEPYGSRPGRKKKKKETNVMLAALTFACAMSVHSFLEGFTLLQNTTQRIVELLLALLLHLIVESFTTGKSREASREKRVAIITAILVFALMIPLGSAVGALVNKYEITEHNQNALILVFESLAGGIFIYVAMMEIITKQKNAPDRVLHLFIIIVGFCLVLLLHFTFGQVLFCYIKRTMRLTMVKIEKRAIMTQLILPRRKLFSLLVLNIHSLVNIGGRAWFVIPDDIDSIEQRMLLQNWEMLEQEADKRTIQILVTLLSGRAFQNFIQPLLSQGRNL